VVGLILLRRLILEVSIRCHYLRYRLFGVF
jgi:hypothetical protein